VTPEPSLCDLSITSTCFLSYEADAVNIGVSSCVCDLSGYAYCKYHGENWETVITTYKDAVESSNDCNVDVYQDIDDWSSTGF